MITKLVKIVFGLVGVISFLVIMLAGLLWMTAVGNDNQVAKSKKMIADAVLGVVIVSLAYAIINTVLFIIMKIGG